MNEENTITTRYGVCSKDCYGACVFNGEWNDQAEEKKFLAAKPLKDHPFTNGFLCQKFNQRERLLYHPDRVKKTLIRNGQKGENSFKTIELDNALNIIAEKLLQVKDSFDSQSILTAYYAGNNGMVSKHAPFRFFGKLGSTITEEGICNEGGCVALEKLFGTYSTTNPFQINNPSNQLIVVWGTNLSERNDHAYSMVKKAKKTGSKLIVVNPIKTNLAEEADLFVQPFPGTDHSIVRYLVSSFIEKDKYDKEFLSQNVENFDIVFEDIKINEEEDIISQIGVEEEVLLDFRQLLWKYKHQTLFLTGFGPQKYFYGGRHLNAIALLQIIHGNIGKPGTGFLYSQSAFNRTFQDPLSDYVTQSARFPPNITVPLATLGNSLRTNDYKILFIYNVNPVSSLSNQNLIKKSLSREDLFVVVLDMFLNETTKYADIVIPAKFDLECDDLLTSYFVPGISLNQGGPCPYPDCVSNYEFFQALAKKIGWGDLSLFQESQENIVKRCIELLPNEIREKLSGQGYYIPLTANKIPFKDLKFPTSSDKIQLKPSYFPFNDSTTFGNKDNDEFYLLSPSHQYFIHSQFSQLHDQYREVFERIYLNPKDIEKLGLTTDQEVLVSNKYGEMKYILAIKPSIKPGVALIYSGSPFNSVDSKNVNVFTPDIPEESRVSGAYFSTVVKISKT